MVQKHGVELKAFVEAAGVDFVGLMINIEDLLKRKVYSISAMQITYSV